MTTDPAQNPREQRAATSVEKLHGELRGRILSGDLEAGTPLREEALSAEYQLGRHTVRAALRQLAAERLVSIQPYSGARVTLLDDDEVRALMQLRSALEGEAVRLLNRRASESGSAAAAASASASARADDLDAANDPDVAHAILAGVYSANDELRRVCRDSPGDRSAIEAAHATLHHAIVEAADSPRITDAHAQLEAESILFLAQLRQVLDAEEMIRQHDQLVADLLLRGEDAIHEHLERAADQLIAARAAPTA
ncbi:GntR family transcriptional regulator [Subtercola endophyticus]|uniref:GntR family transcriptional regulator n=1 Tax=Subtercola endophyticus TaxID=2895559 RepID=UPI001E3F1077|nr:GntR family transcriptional regulator [Subtercola endophyticus]UFS58996.1 GntR family transcriptional regulator [Subtercola endophyticus]